jgi:hypothetical protein
MALHGHVFLLFVCFGTQRQNGSRNWITQMLITVELSRALLQLTAVQQHNQKGLDTTLVTRRVRPVTGKCASTKRWTRGPVCSWLHVSELPSTVLTTEPGTQRHSKVCRTSRLISYFNHTFNKVYLDKSHTVLQQRLQKAAGVIHYVSATLYSQSTTIETCSGQHLSTNVTECFPIGFLSTLTCYKQIIFRGMWKGQNVTAASCSFQLHPNERLL